jgi:ribokinase
LDAGGEDTPLEKDIFPFLYVLSPNETELGRITGMKTDSDAEVELAAQALRSWGVKNVLVKLGERGSAMFAEDGSVIRQNAIHVPAEKIVDTTGAGDCFTAAFAVSMIRSRTHSAQIKNIFKEAMRFASTAATLCIQEKGAIPSMPRFEAVQNQLFQMK